MRLLPHIRSDNILYTKRQCESRLLEQSYWTELCRLDDEIDLINHWSWKDLWEYKGSRMVMIRDPFKRGFLMLEFYTPDDISLSFAFVAKKHRNQHVLTTMFQKIKRVYSGKRISLESREEALPVWKKLGFAEIQNSYYKKLIYHIP